MTTVKEFYKQFDDVERGLVEMFCSPLGNIAVRAKQCLRELYQIKRDLFTVFLSPNEDTPIDLICPSHSYIKKFVDENHDNSSEKSVIIRNKGTNSRFSNDRERDLIFFVERGYVTR